MSSTRQLPKYDWAFDAEGEPVHISQAERGALYQCPITGQRMVARLGDIKQHHFAYDSQPGRVGEVRICPPEDVARAVASRWLEKELRLCLQRRQAVRLTWHCPLCDETHTANLLEDITQVVRREITRGGQPDVALNDAQRRTPIVITVQAPTESQLHAFAQQQIMVLVVDVANRRQHMVELGQMLAGAGMHGGICDTQRRAARLGYLTHADELRHYLSAAVSEAPYHLHGPLTTEGDFTHVLTIGAQRLWLPPLLWQRAIGGLRHAVSPTLHIVSQEWEQPDGATIALYYVTAKETAAVAVRRFPPGEGAYARLPNALFRTPRITADHIARSFAEG